EREHRFACGRCVDSRPHLLGWCSTLPYNANSVRAIVAGPQRRRLSLRRRAVTLRAPRGTRLRRAVVARSLGPGGNGGPRWSTFSSSASAGTRRARHTAGVTLIAV